MQTFSGKVLYHVVQMKTCSISFQASVSKPAPKRSTISLFDDDDDEDDQEEDIFSIKPSTKVHFIYFIL